MMRNRNVEIDGAHCRAICAEIGERLHISLAGELPEMPPQMQLQMNQLRELDEHASPSIVSSANGSDSGPLRKILMTEKFNPALGDKHAANPEEAAKADKVTRRTI
jgi:hypothetical protein